MPVTIKCPYNVRERILAFGVQGTGKSNNILTVARAMPASQFHVIDTDFSESYEVALETEFSDLSNVHPIKVQNDDWQGFMDAVDSARAVCGKDDWVVADSMTPTWQAVQDWFIEKVYGKSIDEYFLEVRMKKEGNRDAKKSKSLGALEGWMDWPVINKQYAPLYTKLTSIPGHLYMTAEQAKINDEDDREVQKMFGPYGVKPAGQKRIGYVPRTVLMMTKSRVGEYAMTTVKDRNRPECEDLPVGDFATDYLVNIAGWKKGYARGPVEPSGPPNLTEIAGQQSLIGEG